MILPISRPIMYEQIVDKRGAVLEPPMDGTIAMSIPAGALSDAMPVSIQVCVVQGVVAILIKI
jgi:hypothetical protein